MHSAQLALRTDEGRGARRRQVCLTAFAREAGATIFQVLVTDLSTEGCRIKGPVELEQGISLWIKISGLAAREARVAWSNAGEAGCEFASAMDVTVLEEFMQARAYSTRQGLLAARKKLRGLPA